MNFHDDPQPTEPPRENAPRCANGCNAPFGIRCSVCNTDKRAEVDNFIEGLTTGLMAEPAALAVERVRTWAAIEAIDNPLAAAAFNRCADEIQRLRAENEALRVDLAFADCRIDDMEATIDRLSVTRELP